MTIIEDLYSAQWGKRLAAVQQLGEQPRPELLPALLGALRDPEARVQVEAAGALVRAGEGHDELRGTIRRALAGAVRQGGSPGVKRAAAAALAALDALPAGQAGGKAPGREVEARASEGAGQGEAPVQGPNRRVAPGFKSMSAQQDVTGAATLADGYEGVDDEHGHQGCPCCQELWVESAPFALQEAADGLASLGLVEGLVALHHGALHPEQTGQEPPRLLHLVDAATRARLQALVRVDAGVVLPPGVEAFLAKYGLEYRPSGVAGSVGEVALRSVLRERQVTPVGEVDWAAVERGLLGALRGEPAAGAELVVLAFHEAIFFGPGELREALARAPWGEGWLPLAPWLSAALGLGEVGELLRGARGSWLALRCMRRWQVQGRRWALSLDQARVSGAGQALGAVLASGGGSLESLDYPEFSLVCRAELVELGREQGLSLFALAARLCDLQASFFSPSRGLSWLLSSVSPGVWGGLSAEVRGELVSTLQRSAAAYVLLRRVGGFETARVRRSQLVDFWQKPGAPRLGGGWAWLLQQAPPDRLVEGVVLALLSELHQPHGEEEGQQAGLKELLIEAARAAAVLHGWQGVALPGQGDMAAAAEAIGAMVRCFDHAPLELLQALGMDQRQGLPRLQGGRVGALEGAFRAVYREALRGRKKASGESTTVLCRPISKQEALYRGDLGRDCSSRSVPLRALCPHNVYYGLFSGDGEQLPGYMTVFEAWATDASGEKTAVLCLETINEPRGLLSGVQQDLLVIFEAIAAQRGLAGLVLSVGQGTWNYQNGHELARCRRARAGASVWLSPADPVAWRLYAARSGEGNQYSSFEHQQGTLLLGELREPSMAMPRLAPFAPGLDRVQPENLAEAGRLSGLLRAALRVTCRGQGGEALGFVSGGA